MSTARRGARLRLLAATPSPAAAIASIFEDASAGAPESAVGLAPTEAPINVSLEGSKGAVATRDLRPPVGSPIIAFLIEFKSGGGGLLSAMLTCYLQLQLPYKPDHETSLRSTPSYWLFITLIQEKNG